MVVYFGNHSFSLDREVWGWVSSCSYDRVSKERSGYNRNTVKLQRVRFFRYEPTIFFLIYLDYRLIELIVLNVGLSAGILNTVGSWQEHLKDVFRNSSIESILHVRARGVNAYIFDDAHGDGILPTPVPQEGFA